MMDRDLRRQIKRKSDAFEESFAGTGVKLLRFSYYPEREKKYVLIVSYHGATHSFAADGDRILHNGRPVVKVSVEDDDSLFATLTDVVRTELFGASRRLSPYHTYEIGFGIVLIPVSIAVMVFCVFALLYDPTPWMIVGSAVIWFVSAAALWASISLCQTISFDRGGFSICVFGVCVSRVAWDRIVSIRVELIPIRSREAPLHPYWIVFFTEGSKLSRKRMFGPPWTIRETEKNREIVTQFAPKDINMI